MRDGSPNSHYNADYPRFSGGESFQATEAAAEPWFRSLALPMRSLRFYLDEASKNGKTARQWREAWQRRLAAIEAGPPTRRRGS